MDIRFFVGAQRTAAQHIYKLIDKNKSLLEAEKKIVVMPDDFLKALKVAYDEMDKGKEREEVFAKFLDTVTSGKEFSSLILMNHRFCGRNTRPVTRGSIYPGIHINARKVRRLFPEDSMKFFMAIRDPGTFLPSCYSEALTEANVKNFREYLADAVVPKLQWSNTISSLIRANPQEGQKMTNAVVWRYEDYPFIWRDVIQAITGIENGQMLEGDLNVVNQGLSLYGSHLMFKYLQKYEPKEPGDFRKVRDAFLDKFPNKDQVADDPEWTPEFIQQLSYSYSDDWYYIERMENVATISQRPRF